MRRQLIGCAIPAGLFGLLLLAAACAVARAS